MIRKNESWKLVDKPQTQQVILVKGVNKVKLNEDRSINQNKEWMVVKDYSQQLGFYYVDTFALVAQMDSIRIITALAEQMKWRI